MKFIGIDAHTNEATICIGYRYDKDSPAVVIVNIFEVKYNSLVELKAIIGVLIMEHDPVKVYIDAGGFLEGFVNQLGEQTDWPICPVHTTTSCYERGQLLTKQIETDNVNFLYDADRDKLEKRQCFIDAASLMSSASRKPQTREKLGKL